MPLTLTTGCDGGMAAGITAAGVVFCTAGILGVMVGKGGVETTAICELGEVAPGKTEVGEPEETPPSC